MRLLQWASLGLIALCTADSNLTHESRNILPSTFKPPQHFRNVNLVRNINLDKNYAKETVNVVIENIDKDPQSDYYIPFEAGTIGRVGGVDVRDKKDPNKGPFVAEVVAIDPHSTTQFYKITLPTPLSPKEQLTLAINYYVLDVLKPRPAQIEQADKQYVSYTFSIYAPSAYTTSAQKTKLKLASPDVDDTAHVPKIINAEGKQDPQKQGTSYTYGPYDEREAGAVQDVSLRYEFTKPLTHSNLLERDVEISHWGGNIAFEERHWFTNHAATLKDHFSRITWQQSTYYSPPTSALREMRFPLAVGSIDAYFVDDIGNVSTSHFRSTNREATLELKPRYPVFGGWNYNFKVGWNSELKNYLRYAKAGSDNYVLKVPFFEGPKQAEGVEYARVVTRVILPEGASNVKFETTVPLVDSSIGLHRTFMDTVGRTTLTLTAVNIVDELRDRDVVITYDYPFAARFRKPLTIFAGILAVFAVSWVVGNLDVSIGTKKTA